VEQPAAAPLFNRPAPTHLASLSLTTAGAYHGWRNTVTPLLQLITILKLAASDTNHDYTHIHNTPCLGNQVAATCTAELAASTMTAAIIINQSS